MKSSLVAVGLGDLMRPADKLSMNQSISLAATGLIWSRVNFHHIFFSIIISFLFAFVSIVWLLYREIISSVLSISALV